MRPVLRPGVRLHRDPAGRAALVERGRVYWVDDTTAGLLDRLDGLLAEPALLEQVDGDADVLDAWRRVREAAVVVDVESAARLVRGVDESARTQALQEATALVAHDPVTADRAWHRRRTATVEVLGAGAVASPLTDLLMRACIGRVPARGGPPDPDVTVLSHDHEPPVDVGELLMRAGRPHLVAGLRGLDGVVGPFVRPGESPCLRCVDLARCAEDPAWGLLRERLSEADPGARVTGPPASAAVTASVAALAAAEVLAQVDGREPATLGTTASMSLDNPLPTGRNWHPQPACGCTWDTHFPTR